MEALKYPIGRFDWSGSLTSTTRSVALADIAALPLRLRQAVAGLNGAELATPYRPEGWTVTQVVHHVADSHLNGFNRVKLGLTEDNPKVKPYPEAKYAELGDMALPAEVSLRLIDALHERWTALLASMSDAEFRRPIDHPDFGAAPLDRFVHLYGWHSRHHVAHITELRKRQGW